MANGCKFVIALACLWREEPFNELRAGMARRDNLTLPSLDGRG